MARFRIQQQRCIARRRRRWVLLSRCQLGVRRSFKVLLKEVLVVSIRIKMQSEQSRIRASSSCGNASRANWGRRSREPIPRKRLLLLSVHHISWRRKAAEIAQRHTPQTTSQTQWRVRRGSSNSWSHWSQEQRARRYKLWTSSFPKGSIIYILILPSRAVWSSGLQQALLLIRNKNTSWCSNKLYLPSNKLTSPRPKPKPRPRLWLWSKFNQSESMRCRQMLPQ